MGFAFYNYVVVGADNDGFTDSAPRTVTSGIYRFDAFIVAFLAAWQTANRRVTLSSSGHLTLDNNGGANFDITFSDTALGQLLGFTPSGGGPHLTGANTYTGPRRVRCCCVAYRATLADFDPQPMGFAKQTRSMGGVTRTTFMGRRYDRCTFGLQMLDSSARLTSPSGAVATTYANAASTEDGLTEYRHARDFWSDCTSASNQGWTDGRPVSFFEDSANAVFTMTSASSAAWAALTTYSDWVFEESAIAAFPREKVRPPQTTHYALVLPATEYVSP